MLLKKGGKLRSSYSEQEENPEFWFNLKTLQVEVGKLSASPNRVGPFKTRQEASSALETLRRKSAEWNEADESNQ